MRYFLILIFLLLTPAVWAQVDAAALVQDYPARKAAGKLSVVWRGHDLARLVDTEYGIRDFTPGWLTNQPNGPAKTALAADLYALSRPAKPDPPEEPPEDADRAAVRAALRNWDSLTQAQRETATKRMFLYMLRNEGISP